MPATGREDRVAREQSQAEYRRGEIARNAAAVSGVTGTLAALDAVTESYSVSNNTTVRTLDASAADGSISAIPTQAEVENLRDALITLLDYVATLSSDLKGENIIG